MEKVIGMCGLICSDCPAYIATQNDDDEERKKTAQSWTSDEYRLKPGDINCDGCITTGNRIMSFCFECDIRQCGVEREVENCAHCDEYPCGKLEKPFEKNPGMKATLDEIRSNL